MNLREMRSEVHTLLGDMAFKKLTPGEVIHYLNRAQDVVARELINIEREAMIKSGTQAATASTAEYDLPKDVQDIVRVKYAGKRCTPLPVRELDGPDENTMMRALKGFQQFFYIKKGSAPNVKRLGIIPTPDDTTNITFDYIILPVEFRLNGSATLTTTALAGDTTTVVSTAAPMTGSGETDAWDGASIRMTSGDEEGAVRYVSSWDGTSDFTVSSAFGSAIASGVTFELDQVSNIPAVFHDLITAYASMLAAMKLDAGEKVQATHALYSQGMARLKGKWLENVEVSIPGELPTPIHPGARK